MFAGISEVLLVICTE